MKILFFNKKIHLKLNIILLKQKYLEININITNLIY